MTSLQQSTSRCPLDAFVRHHLYSPKRPRRTHSVVFPSSSQRRAGQRRRRRRHGAGGGAVRHGSVAASCGARRGVAPRALARVASGKVAESFRARSMRRLPRSNISLVECEPDDTAYLRARRAGHQFPSRKAVLRCGGREPQWMMPETMARTCRVPPVNGDCTSCEVPVCRTCQA